MDHIDGLVQERCFSHDRLWILPWIKSISNELDIIIHVITWQLSGHCDVINKWLWCHQQNEKRVSETREQCVNIVVLSSFMDLLCHVRNEIMYALSWQTVSALTRGIFWCLFPKLLMTNCFNAHERVILGNRHKNNPLMSVETVRHSSTNIIIYNSNALAMELRLSLC